MEYILWYWLGVMGFIFAREALNSGEREKYPIKVKTIFCGAFFSLAGPLTIIVAIIWWICEGFDRHPLLEWKIIRPLRRLMNYKLSKDDRP